MDIEKIVKRSTCVGFECDMCYRKFSTTDDESWEISKIKGKLFRDDNAPDWIYADFCETCYLKVINFIKENGGRINKD